ncbi:MAG: MoaD/ThiS family protein [Ilumatobacteraceae bacterium]
MALIVRLRQPRREVTVRGGRVAHRVLEDLGLAPAGHLIIRNGTLVPSDTMLDDDDVIEVRPVVSGG